MRRHRAVGPSAQGMAILASAALAFAVSAHAQEGKDAAPAMPSTGPGFTLKAPGVDMNGVWEIEHYVG